MRIPPFLKDSGTIGFVAPSFGCATEPYISLFDNALKNFTNMGYKTKLGPNARAAEGIGISNTPEKCGIELNEAYKDKEIDAIISCGGGELMCEVVPYIDFDAVKKADPKWYMGYSDNTNFTFLSATLADTAAIYGPCATSFGMEPWHPAIGDALDLITGKNTVVHSYDMWEGPAEKTEEDEDSSDTPAAPTKEELREENPLMPYAPNRETVIKYYLPGANTVTEDSSVSFEGRLLGGCMDCLGTLLGTRFDKVSEFNKKYAEDGVFWFLEACDLNVMSIRRTLWQMKNAGWFDNAKGFLIGRPYFFGQDMMGLDQYNAVTGILSDLNVPILMDTDIGHLPPMMPLITGAYAKVEATGNNVSITHVL